MFKKTLKTRKFLHPKKKNLIKLEFLIQKTMHPKRQTWWRWLKVRFVPLLLILCIGFVAVLIARIDDMHQDIKLLKRYLELEFKIKLT